MSFEKDLNQLNTGVQNTSISSRRPSDVSQESINSSIVSKQGSRTNSNNNSSSQSPKLNHLNTIPNSPPMSSSHSQLSSDIQARLLAFQQKRTHKILEKDEVQNRNNSEPNISEETTKPIPPLPNQQMRSLSSNDTTDPRVANELSPKASLSSRLPRSPQQASRLGSEQQSGDVSSSSTIALSTTLTNSSSNNLSPAPSVNPPFELNNRRPSISQRRGMKLNVNDINNTPTQPTNTGSPLGLNEQSNQEPIINTNGELSRRLSERKKRPNFKLNLSNDTPDSSKNSPSSIDSALGNDSGKQLQGLFANYSKYIDIKSGSLNFTGKASLHSKGVDFLSGSSFHISLDQLEFIEELGRGNYGTVSKVLHKPTGVSMAMKEVRLELDEKKFTQILMELEVLHKCNSPFIVDFYGAFFVEGAVYMCIEYMEGGSLDKIYEKDMGIHNESYLAYITESVIRGLKELKDEHNIIHRDVKPTNILVNSNGKVKLCDFGVSGNLVASLAKTNIGCQSYMAPERIKTLNPDDNTYSIQSDIWSLGLTILEIAKGNYPYPAETYNNIFSQLSAIVDGDPPRLDGKVFSKNAQLFVKSCLHKNPDLRPTYSTLLNHPWLQSYRQSPSPDFDKFVQERIRQYKDKDSTGKSKADASSSASNASATAKSKENVSSLLKGKVRAPALHRGGLLNNNRSFVNR